MKTLAAPTQPYIPVAKVRCRECRRVFVLCDHVADSLISKLFFSRIHLGGLVQADCRYCESVSASLIDAGYVLARS